MKYGKEIQSNRMESMRIFLLALMVVTVSIFGCDRPNAEQGASGLDEGEYFTRSQVWPDEPQRIVSLAPNITEVLFELGLGQRVVGVTRYCDWPPATADIASIGGMLDPDYEAILAARPDVVIGAIDGADHQVVERLANADIAYGFIKMDDIASIHRGILLLGQWLGVEEEASELDARFGDELGEASRQVRRQLDAPGSTALIVFDQEPIVAAGRDTFGDELLTLAGLQNALGDGAGHYPVLDMEQVLSMDPAMIIDVSIGPEESEVQRFWARFDSLEAVRSGRVVHIDDPVMMRPGPRLPGALELLGEAVSSP